MAEGLLFDIAGSVAEQAIGSLGSLVLKELGLLWGVKGELQKLQNTVSAIQAVLLDAEEKQVGNNAVRHWLARLEDVVYEADDLLDDFSTEILLREMMTKDKKAKKVRLFFSKSNQLYYGLKMAHKIKAIREKLDAIAADRQFNLEIRTEGKKIGVSSSEQRYSHSFVLAEEVFGREDDKEKLIGFLLRESNLKDNVAMLSIVGFGGLGKTTLAQLLFNDEKVKKYFELKMWVCVSDNFDVGEIVKKMIESATDKKPGDVGMDNLIREVGKLIGGKKYFLVLDDVWNEDDIEKWDELQKLLLCGARGSRVLVTTRSEKVANIGCSVESYKLKGLEENESWSLFKQMAFRNKTEPERSTFIAVGKKILKECRGVPLVIRTIGRLLHSKGSEEEWSCFLTNELPKVKGKHILETLKLSYDHLPSHLKHCFAYCSIFPKDFIIKKSMLINLWIAQGFIKPTDQNQCLEDIAHDYFIELLWRSFFQEAQTDEFSDIDNCKMHDFMHDLAVKVSGLSVTTFDPKNKLLDESKTRHVAIGDFDSLSAVPTFFSKACTMRTVLVPSESGLSSLTESTLNAIFSNLKLLRTLDLHSRILPRLGSGIDVVPSSVSKLKHLRYLDFSENEEIKKLPNSITSLQNLHTLRLSCLYLEELPRDIKKLINLRHLEIEECWSLKYMPRGLGQLTNLMILSMFVVNSGGGVAGNSAGLDELNGLNKLRGKLNIRELAHGKDVASEYKAANLKNKHLHTLELQWTFSTGEDIVDDEKQLEVLEPHPNLKKLSLRNYGGVRFPNNWLLSLTNLVSLSLNSCTKLKYLPPLSQLPSLNSLNLSWLYDLEYILDSDMVSASSSTPIAYFPSLKAMKFYECPKLKGWCRRMDSLETMTVKWMEDYPNLLPSFPLLSELEIWDCPMLTSMPTFPHLEELFMKSASWKPLQQTMMTNVAALESRSAATASPALVASSPTPLSQLKSLTLKYIEDLRSLPEEGLRNLISLQDLSICSCERLETLSRGIQHLTTLQTLSLQDCDELDLGKDGDWMHWQGLTSLRTLTIERLPKLVSLPDEGLQNLTSLQYLSINSCKRLKTLSRSIQHLTALQTLSLQDCDELDLGKDDDWMHWQGLKSLHTLQIYGLPKLVSLPSGLQHLITLRAFEIKFCDSLTAIPDWIHKWTSLEEFKVYCCTSLTSLPEGMRRLTSLQKLRIFDCPILLQRCERHKGEDWPKIAHIPDMSICST